MPYIRQDERVGLDELIDPLADRIASPGQASYVITRLVMRNLTELSYSKAALYVGVLVLTALELWWRVIQPYEDNKRKENTDVYHK